MKIRALLYLGLCVATVARAEDGEFRKLPPLKLGHYAQSADITFSGCTLAQHEADIRQQMKRKFPDIDMDALPARMMIEGMALMVKGSSTGKPCLVGKYYNQVIDAYNAYPAVAKAIAESGTPAPFQEALKHHYAALMIKRGLRVDVDEICSLLKSIPPDSRCVSIAENATLASHVTRAFPGFASLPPLSKKAVLDYLAAINPEVHAAGWYRTPDVVKESWEHLAIPVKEKETHVGLYRVAPNASVLIPPAAALSALAAESARPMAPPPPGTDLLTGTVIERPNPKDKGLAVLSFSSAGGTALCDHTVLTVRLDDGKGSENHAYATTPAFSSLAHDVDISGLTIHDNAIKGEALVHLQLPDDGPPVPCSYTLDAALKGGSISGSFTCTYGAGKAGEKAAAGGVQATGNITGHVKTRSASVPDSHRLAANATFTGWRGTSCNGSSPAPQQPLVDSSEKIRLAWRSADYVPTSRPSWPLCGGGFASPIIADGRVYLFYYVPSGSHYNEEAIAAAENAMKKRGGTLPKNDRENWRIDADEVFHCIDAATGWTIWRTRFKEHGFSYRRIGGGSEKSGAHLTPAVSHGKGRRLCYAMGTGGNVYAVDAETGEPAWKSDIGERAEAFRCFVAAARKAKGFVPLNRDMCGCAVVAGDTVACNNHVQYQGGQRVIGNGLIAFDRLTGKKKWEVPDCLGWFGTAIRWTHKDQEYFIAVGSRAVCVEPATGKVLWEIPDARHDNAPAVTEDYLVCNASGDTGITAYRITPQAAKKAWSIGPAGGLCGMLILDGRVYVQCSSGTTESLLCLDLASGKTLASAPISGGLSSSLVGSGGRILREWGTKKKEGFIMVNADPKALRQLGGPMKVSYANSVTPTIVDGRAFVRGTEALYCYDLRAGVTTASANGEAAAKLAKALHSKDMRLARCALVGLGNLEAAAAKTGPDLAAILKGNQAELWDPAAAALMRIGPAGRKAVISTLADILATQKKRTASTLTILSRIGPGIPEKETKQMAVRAAAGALQDQGIELKKAAGACLGGFGPDAAEAVPALKKAYLEPPLREAARAALEKIQPGKPVEVRPEMDVPELGEL